jgi:hypothetical protein
MDSRRDDIRAIPFIAASHRLQALHNMCLKQVSNWQTFF